MYIWGITVKIQNQYKINQNESVSKSSKKKGAESSNSTSAEGGTQVELSESAGFVQGLRELAEGTDPQSVRMDVVESSREDLRRGLLGTDEDYEQAIASLVLEKNDFEE
jgi:hypothetical protein